MAWEWSHTQEAYDNAYGNVHKLSKQELITILREWAYYDREQAGKRGSFRLTFNPRKLRKDILVDAVWERMSDYRTCTNGGFSAYCCPDGCHLVSFGD